MGVILFFIRQDALFSRKAKLSLQKSISESVSVTLLYKFIILFFSFEANKFLA